MTNQLVPKNEFYVYVYLDPRKPGHFTYGDFCFLYEPFYVGKGKKDRYRSHIREAFRDETKSTLKLNKIRKIKRETNLEPYVIKILENATDVQAKTEEISLIKQIGRSCLGSGPLVNLAAGGEGSSGFVWSEASRKKLSDSTKGRVMSLETREKIRQANLGRQISEETREKLKKKRPSAESLQRGIETKRKNGTLACSEEHKRKIGDANRGKRGWSAGKTLGPRSEETKEKIRAALKGRKKSNAQDLSTL